MDSEISEISTKLNESSHVLTIQVQIAQRAECRSRAQNKFLMKINHFFFQQARIN